MRRVEEIRAELAALSVSEREWNEADSLDHRQFHAFMHDAKNVQQGAAAKMRFLLRELDAALKVVEAAREVADLYSGPAKYPTIEALAKALREWDARDGGDDAQ